MAKANIGNAGRSRKLTTFQAYRIVCSVNGKVYIGITVQGYVTRFSQHIRRPFGKHRGGEFNTHISRAIRRHGPASFSIAHIASAASFEDLLALEIILIAQHRTLWPYGYNRSAGGEGCLGVSHSVSEQQRADIRLALTGRKLTEAHKAAIAAGVKASITDERRARLSVCRTGPDHLMGTSWNGSRWISQIRVGNRTRHIGCFASREAAHQAFNEAKSEWVATSLWREFPAEVRMIKRASGRAQRGRKHEPSVQQPMLDLLVL